MENNQFENCRPQFVGPAGNTLNFLKVLYASGSTEMVEQIFQQIRGGVSPHAPAQNATLQ